MNTQVCSVCKKRLAVIFVNRLVNGEMKNEGYCLQCAGKLNDPNIANIINNFKTKMNIPEDALEMLDKPIDELDDVPNFAEMMAGEEDGDENEDESGDGHVPSMNKFFSQLMGGLKGKNGENAQGEKSEHKNPKKKFLSLYCTDLTEKAKKGGIDDVIGRDTELSRVMQILCRRQKNNPCLIGEPGVGKTAVAEALALKIARGDVPYKLMGKEVHLLDMTSLVAGTQFRGQFEKRMKDLIDEVKRLGNIILVIDEVHTIASAGDAEGSMNASNILKPALSRGEIQVIGATTLTEYRKYIEKDAALERRFQPVIIEEPSLEDCVKILEGISKYYEQFHGIKADKAILRRTVVLSERYITDRFLPDKAIDLLDEALSAVALSSPVLSKYDMKKDELKAVKDKKTELEAISEPEDSEKYFKELAEVKANELRLEDEVGELKKEADGLALTEDDLAKVIEMWTGIPARNIVEGDSEKIARLEENIKAKIIGQDEAVDAVCRAVKRNRAGVSAKRKPVSFIFAGPTGVGKTELVKVLASSLFDSPETLIRLDMSEFMEKFAVSRIIGAPPGYVGYDEAGQLTEKIRRKPYSVVLFDEIEKAHPDVMNILLQILDDGRVTDSQGRTVNFENTVIVMTTNAGSGNSSAIAGFGETTHITDQKKTEKALSSFLRPEFINRVDEIITFNHLSRDNFTHIASIMLDEVKTALSERGIKFVYDEAAAKYVAENSYSEKLGARNMRRYISKHIEDKIADMIFGNSSLTAVSVGVKDGELFFEKI